MRILYLMMRFQSSNTTPSVRHRFDAVVVVNDLICREHYILDLQVKPAVIGPFPPTQPGQFIQLRCAPPRTACGEDRLYSQSIDLESDAWPDLGEAGFSEGETLLRRPFSLAGRWDNADGSVCLRIIYRVVGMGTQWLSRLQPGDPVDLIGPLGNSFQLPAGKQTGFMVGGGVGLPPMFYLGKKLTDANWNVTAFVGAQSADLLALPMLSGQMPRTDGVPSLCAEVFAQNKIPVSVTTDDGTLGRRGRVTDGLEPCLQAMNQTQRDQAMIFACGPTPMLRAIAAMARQYRVACQVCMEQAMACGMGTCQSCVIRIADSKHSQSQHPQGSDADHVAWRYRLTCTDGPVFDATQVIWQ